MAKSQASGTMKIALVFAAAMAVSLSQAHIQIEAKLTGSAKVGENNLEVKLKGHEGNPLRKADVKVSVSSLDMDMGSASPAVTERGDGLYVTKVKFEMPGKWRVLVSASAANEEATSREFTFTTGQSDTSKVEHNHQDMSATHEMTSMKGRLGDWEMSREGSGTSWMPDDSPMFMKSLGVYGGFDTHLMGLASVNFSDAGGLRGESQLFSNSMAMVMGRRETGSGVWGASAMFSLDPIFNGKRGYPNLFQTGETADGQPLSDRQHPHDLIAELAVTYSQPIGNRARLFFYGAPIGEPALGGPMYLHRASGMENPEAPISHHWFDSTHITFGVLSAGVSFGDKVQVEGSIFNGREPDENRYNIDPIRFDSASGRISFNPTREWALQLSYGFLREPEALEPGVDQHRLTASAIYARRLENGDHLSATGFFGQNIKADGRTSALGLEATWFHRRTSYFARAERVEKDELVGVPAGTHTVGKLTFGAVRDLASSSGFDFGVGGFVGIYSVPGALKPFYGRSPVSFGIFFRVRPTQMSHEQPMPMGKDQSGLERL